MMRSTLAHDLVTRLPADSFVFPDAPALPGTRMLVVTVLSAQVDGSGTLALQAEWTLMSGRPARASLTRQVTLQTAIPCNNAASQAAALSRALGALADRIAASIVAP